MPSIRQTLKSERIWHPRYPQRLRKSKPLTPVLEYWNPTALIISPRLTVLNDALFKILSTLEGNDNQFQDRRSARKKNSIVKLNRNLHKLDPFIDKEGLLRVGGRLKSATSPYAIKHPVILPKGNHTTVLLIR